MRSSGFFPAMLANVATLLLFLLSFHQSYITEPLSTNASSLPVSVGTDISGQLVLYRQLELKLKSLYENQEIFVPHYLETRLNKGFLVTDHFVKTCEFVVINTPAHFSVQRIVIVLDSTLSCSCSINFVTESAGRDKVVIKHVLGYVAN